jgi:MOSC domain-containing protein YiiM
MSAPNGIILAVNIADSKGRKKTNVGCGLIMENFGLQKDAHAGSDRQVSLLAKESIEKIRQKGLDVWYGDFAENLTTEGIDLPLLPVGARLQIGSQVLLEVTQIGKVCHDHCAIYRAAGDCVMPREGIFVRVLEGGPLRAGDEVVVESLGDGFVEGVPAADGLADVAGASGDGSDGDARPPEAVERVE